LEIELEERSRIDTPDVQDNHPRYHEDDSSRNNKGIKDEKNGAKQRPGGGRGLRKKQIEDGFAE
jgi:hypothetical protein